MTYPNQQPAENPRPAAPPGGFRPAPPPGGFRPGPPPGGFRPGSPSIPQPQRPAQAHRPDDTAGAENAGAEYAGAKWTGSEGTGHPAVDAVLQSLANAATLAPADQIAEYEAAHQVLQETLAGIDR